MTPADRVERFLDRHARQSGVDQVWIHSYDGGEHAGGVSLRVDDVRELVRVARLAERDGAYERTPAEEQDSEVGIDGEVLVVRVADDARLDRTLAQLAGAGLAALRQDLRMIWVSWSEADRLRGASPQAWERAVRQARWTAGK